MPFVLSLITMQSLYFASSCNLHLYTLVRFPRKAFFSKFQELASSQPLLVWQMLQSLIHLCGFLQYLVRYVHICIILRSQRLDTALQMNREDRSLPGNVLPNTAQDSAGLLATRVHCWFIFSLVTIRHSLVFFCKAVHPWLAPSVRSCLGLLLPEPSTLHCPLLHCTRLLSAHFSSLHSPSDWLHNHPVHQPLLPSLHYLETPYWCTLPHHQVTDEDINARPQHQCLAHATTSGWPPAGLCANAHSLWGLAAQPVSNLSHFPLIQPVLYHIIVMML